MAFPDANAMNGFFPGASQTSDVSSSKYLNLGGRAPFREEDYENAASQQSIIHKFLLGTIRIVNLSSAYLDSNIFTQTPGSLSWMTRIML